MNVTAIMKRLAETCPDELALVDVARGMQRTVTYAEFEQRIGQTVSLLRAHGLVPGDTVLLLVPMSIELYVVFAATLRLGMTVLFIDPTAGREYVTRCCELLPPRAFVASSKAHLLRVISPALRKIPIQVSVGCRVPWTTPLERSCDSEYDRTVIECEPNTPALVSFTSGSSGPPKGTVRTHRFLDTQHRVIERRLELTPGDVEYVSLPIFVLANLASRVTSILPGPGIRRDSANIGRMVADQIERQQVNRLSSVPAVLERLADECKNNGRNLPSLRRILTGGGPVRWQLIERLFAIAPHADVSVVYGSTEAEPISVLRSESISAEDRERTLSGAGLLVGSPIPEIEVRIIADRTGEIIDKLERAEFDNLSLPSGQTGEIVVRGDHVLSSYLQRESDLPNKIRVGDELWHRTGDAGRFDAQARLWLLGRCEAAIDDERGQVYPLGIEQAACSHQGVRKAALVGSNGQLLLVIETERALSKSEIKLLRDAVGRDVVDGIKVVAKLPMDRRHHSKIDYAAVRQLLD